ncbi:MAG: glycosyltransferase family 2 protein [Capsulimonadaceae bacterium]|nr:glycosyltransferase family 2 protein [Capsulimonadaceae bacterium]
MLDIAVIVVNWNAREDLSACLASLFATPPPAVQWAVWVVDNASSDGSADMTASQFPDAHLVVNTENVGFSRANNRAIALASDYRYVFLLNSDAAVETPQALDQLVAFADQHPEAAVIGPHVLNPDGTLQFSCRSFPNLWAGLFRNTLLGRLFPRNPWARNYLMADFDHTKACGVHWVSGCAMLIRQDFIQKFGALDPDFYMYCEDVDICKRAWDNGLSVWYFPGATIVHKIGASSDKSAEKMIWAFHESWMHYYEKHFPHQPRWKHWLVRWGLWLRATVRIWNRRRRGVRPDPVLEAQSPKKPGRR